MSLKTFSLYGFLFLVPDSWSITFFTKKEGVLLKLLQIQFRIICYGREVLTVYEKSFF